MQGIMFVELSRYVDERLGADGWTRVLDGAGLGGRVYAPDFPAPDDDFMGLVTTTSTMTDRPVQDVLEDFGRFVAPDLLGGLYGLLVDPAWDLIDFLEHTEGTIHTVVRARDRAASPPKLRVERLALDEVLIVYDSPRKLCSLAKGIVRGAAEHYHEPVEIDELNCMLNGDPRCEILVRRSDPRG